MLRTVHVHGGCIDSLLDREADGRLARDEARPEDRGKATIRGARPISRRGDRALAKTESTRFGGSLRAGCLNRPIDELVREEGFQIDELETEYLPGPRGYVAPPGLYPVFERW
jgi:hypothetical protein